MDVRVFVGIREGICICYNCCDKELDRSNLIEEGFFWFIIVEVLD